MEKPVVNVQVVDDGSLVVKKDGTPALNVFGMPMTATIVKVVTIITLVLLIDRIMIAFAAKSLLSKLYNSTLGKNKNEDGSGSWIPCADKLQLIPESDANEDENV